MGLLLAGENAAAVDWIGAYLLGYPPENIPIVREALGTFCWPLTSFGREDIRLVGDLGEGVADEVLRVARVNELIILLAGRTWPTARGVALYRPEEEFPAKAQRSNEEFAVRL